MNKKAQFYFLAAIVFASVFIALITISNKATSPNPPSFSEEGENIDIEISFLLDYFSRQEVSPPDSKNILINFSDSYITKFGWDKEIFFIFGVNTSATLVGYKEEGTELYVDTGGGNTLVSETGRFQKEYALTGANTTIITLDGNAYNFTFYPGQNVYYLIKSSYNEETFVSNGGTASSL